MSSLLRPRGRARISLKALRFLTGIGQDFFALDFRTDLQQLNVTPAKTARLDPLPRRGGMSAVHHGEIGAARNIESPVRAALRGRPGPASQELFLKRSAGLDPLLQRGSMFKGAGARSALRDTPEPRSLTGDVLSIAAATVTPEIAGLLN